MLAKLPELYTVVGADCTAEWSHYLHIPGHEAQSTMRKRLPDLLGVSDVQIEEAITRTTSREWAYTDVMDEIVRMLLHGCETGPTESHRGTSCSSTTGPFNAGRRRVCNAGAMSPLQQYLQSTHQYRRSDPGTEGHAAAFPRLRKFDRGKATPYAVRRVQVV
jgi:hypothetical protein